MDQWSRWMGRRWRLVESWWWRRRLGKPPVLWWRRCVGQSMVSKLRTITTLECRRRITIRMLRYTFSSRGTDMDSLWII